MSISITIQKKIIIRNFLFSIFEIALVLIFYAPIKLLLVSSFENELYSHIIIIPVVSIYLLYIRRREIFKENSFSLIHGSIFIVVGILFYFVGTEIGADFDQNDYLSLMTFAAVICWIGGFVLFYGIEASRIAFFPLLFLFFMVPVPSFLMERIILVLQACSAEVSYWIFKITGVPIYREGFFFYLPGLTIEVAKQCGGIRSSLVLFIISILAGHLFLTSWKKKFILTLCIFPITIIKNSIRIVVLSLLGAYVDFHILSGTLHTRGGIPFFLMALSLLGVVLWLLIQSERRRVLK